MVETRLRTILFAHEIQARIAELAGEIEADHPPTSGMPPLRLIGVLSGAFFFLSDLARALQREATLDFLSVRSYGGGTQSSGKIEVTKDLDEPIEGLNVVLVDDIVDTGQTIHHLLGLLKPRAPHSLRVAVLLNKPSRRVQPVELNYVGFEIPDHFVVGYGLDHGGRYRNLRDVCVLQTAGKL